MRIYKPRVTIEYFDSFNNIKARKWYWFLRASNGKRIAFHGPHSSKDSCLKNFHLAKKLMKTNIEIEKEPKEHPRSIREKRIKKLRNK